RLDVVQTGRAHLFAGDRRGAADFDGMFTVGADALHGHEVRQVADHGFVLFRQPIQRGLHGGSPTAKNAPVEVYSECRLAASQTRFTFRVHPSIPPATGVLKSSHARRSSASG